MSHHTNNIKPRSIIGLGLIIFALMLLFDNLGLHFIGKIFSHWPIALIIIGGALLYGPLKIDSQNKPKSNLPYFLIGFGVLFFLAQHHFFNFNFSRLIGPAILLAIGIHILRPNNKRKHHQKCNDNDDDTEDYDLCSNDSEVKKRQAQEVECNTSTTEGENRIDVFNVLGGSEFSTYSKNLTCGNIVCVLGGAEIDLREADVAGDTIELEILAFMGGAEIKIPPHWQVSVKAIPLLGGVSNKTSCLAEKLQVPKKHLIITGLALMGGIDIRN